MGLPFMTQKDVVEVVIDHEQFLGQLLIRDAWNELQDPLLHGTASAVEFLRGEVGHSGYMAGQGYPSWIVLHLGLLWRKGLQGTTK